ncbi:hypothetical protein [Agromyces humi]|uniref:hypothetical protein n=1 Tax=Agromyces humi TaxID=1766800 RepID=UPI00135A8DF3|nr:hypothetical protein [Agromyces humi]
MSHHLASAGYTIDPTLTANAPFGPIDRQELLDFAAPFVDLVVPHLRHLDDGWVIKDRVEEKIPKDAGHEEYVAAQREVTHDMLVEGLHTHLNECDDSAGYDIGATGLVFVVWGETTHGDMLFEEVAFLARAAALIPALQQATGILGPGILTERP